MTNSAASQDLSELLTDLGRRLEADETSVGAILDHLGDRAAGLTLFILALPTAIPSPGVPAGMIFGTGLMLVAIQMISGAERFRLPTWLNRRRLPTRHVVAVLERAAAWAARLHAHLRPRMAALTRPGRLRLLGAVVGFQGFLIALPIPFGNTLPGLGVLAIAVGLIARDGLAVLVGLGLSLLATITSVALVAAGWWLISAGSGV